MEKSDIIIDRDICTGCRLCVAVCPTGTIILEEGKAVLTGEGSIGCGHCEAVCPVGAIRVGTTDPEMSGYKTLDVSRECLPPGDYDGAGLVMLMASRRSCRNYTRRPIEIDILEDLVKIGVTAPSGTNCQQWTFTLVPTRSAVLSFGGRVVRYYERLNSLAEKGYVRSFLRLIGKGELDAYYHSYHRKVQRAIEEWHESGKDSLFHGATAALVIGSCPGASCPVEDALLATQNILLAAHAMGLGTCLIGFAVEAMRRDRSIQRFIGIPGEEAVHSVIALGYPDEVYQRTAGRKKVVMRYFEG
jgi:nitroreductase/NAD-dependent dihydropyrimidine dehydrogenase PreA subunit